MNIIIIEDELKTAKALGQLIVSIEPLAKIITSIQSVGMAVRYLAANPKPDLIFMDIQLADGLCFEIFKLVKVVSPVVFCTAYDEYALDAFRSNGVDYILKPFSKTSVGAALDKVHQLKNFFQVHEGPLPELENLINRLGANGKKGFLVFKNNKYITIQTTNVAYFYIRNDTTMLVTAEDQEYPLTQSLDEIHTQLDQSQFFRCNRQYLISYSAVKEVEPYFSRKLFVRLIVPTEEKLLIGKDKAAAFLEWLEKR